MSLCELVSSWVYRGLICRRLLKNSKRKKGRKENWNDRQRKKNVQERQAQAKAEEQKRDIELKKLELEIKKTELEARLEVFYRRSQNTDEDNDDDVDNDEVVVRRGVGCHSSVKGPKMSPFDDRNDMDSYLHRFERYTLNCKIG